jgi:prolipoprotein diacylglyceryl transferase
MMHEIIPRVFPAPPGPTIGIGPIELRAYGLLIAIGVLAAIWLMGRRLEARGVGTRDDASAIGLWSVLAGLVGARLYHVVTDWSRFSDAPGDIIAVWKGGLGIPGGLLLGITVGLLLAKRRGISPAAAATCAAPAIPLAQAIGRWGNWFNQELFGRPTDLPWALEVTSASALRSVGFPEGTTFHPTFLYESLWLLGLVAVLLWIDKYHDPGPGRLMGIYVLGYGIGRFWIEGLRIDRANEFAGLRVNQWVSLAAIVGSIVYLWLTRHRTEWPARPSDTADEPVDDPADEPADDTGGTATDTATDTASDTARDTASETATETATQHPDGGPEQPAQ